MKPIKQTTWLTIMIIILLGISVAQMVNMRFTYQKISTLQDAVLILQNVEIDRQLAEAKEYESPLPPEEIAPIVPQAALISPSRGRAQFPSNPKPACLFA